jgi:hypothetical protein
MSAQQAKPIVTDKNTFVVHIFNQKVFHQHKFTQVTVFAYKHKSDYNVLQQNKLFSPYMYTPYIAVLFSLWCKMA